MGLKANWQLMVLMLVGAISALPAAATDDHLMLCEAVVTPTSDEFLEISNPTAAVVALDNYYLSDDDDYALLPGLTGGGPAPVVATTDFIVRFPPGSSINPGQVLVIAFDGAAFATTFGTAPDFEIIGTDPGTPDMILVAGGLTPGLTNSGENAVLFTWDGIGDLVQDVDMVNIGTPSSTNDIGNKTGLSVDGPDADTTASTYLADAATMPQQSTDPGFGFSTKRTTLESGNEASGGGNGITGDDETTENIAATWDSVFTAPNPGVCTITPLEPTFVINEIHADPDATILGDANGDGVRDASEDEFVEIVNTTGADVDMSGWTLSDGVGVRHTFPASTIVADQCSVVVFGGGTPTGSFGGAVVQTASSGLLGLNNGGDTISLNDGISDIVVVTYGAEGGNNQSLTLDPDITGTLYVLHSTATGSGGALFSPGTLIDGATFTGCTVLPTLEIFDIQGTTDTSPVESTVVETLDNIVTAVGPSSFFMQTPDARADADPLTSDGIMVYTGSAPTVAVGDQVDVMGEVVEFFGLTEFSNNPTVSVDSSGNPLPTPVTLDAATPSPIPSSVPDMERLEGMRVQMAAGLVTGPTDNFGDASIVAGGVRTFREPGIEFPGLPGLPVWDGNPEVFEINPDALGGPDSEYDAGTALSAEGVISFSFGDYQLYPTSPPVTGPPPFEAPRAVAVPPPGPGEMTIATQNLYRLFNDVDDGNGEPVPTAQEYADRLGKLSLHIRLNLQAPDVLAVQEVENLSTLQDLADVIVMDDPLVNYTPYLVEGNDVSGIDVGFLVRDTIAVDSVTQEGAAVIFPYDGSLLFDRPPLVLQAQYIGGGSFTVMVNHLRSMGSIDDPVDGDRVRQKRHAQATWISQWTEAFQTANPTAALIHAGDFNAFEFTDGYVDVMGQLIGQPSDATQALIPGTDEITTDLTNQTLNVPAADRYSYIFYGNAQALDHILTSQTTDNFVTGIAFSRGNADIRDSQSTVPGTALRSSDHDGIVLYLSTAIPVELMSFSVE